MNFNLSELEDLFYSIKEIIEYIENTDFEKRRLKIYLSNGEYLNFSIPNNSIPHLLGIDTTYLVSTRLFKSTNSFEVLKELIANPYKIHNSVSKNIISYNALFSEHILEKVNEFRNNIMLDIKNIEFICKYDKERTYGTNLNVLDCNYIIFKRLPDSKYGLLYLVRNNGYYFPMSSQIYDSYEKAIEKLKGISKFQEITLINAFNIFTIGNEDFNKSYYLNFDDKKQKLFNLMAYKKELDCSIDVSKDFIYTMSKFEKNATKRDDMYKLVEIISNCISEGKIIDTNELETTALFPIITAFNDFLYSNEYESNKNNGNTYTSLIDNLNTLKKRVQELESENERLRTDYKDLCGENNRLSSDNAKLNKAQNEIFEIIKKTR